MKSHWRQDVARRHAIQCPRSTCSPRKIIYVIVLACTLAVISGAFVMTTWFFRGMPADYEVFREYERILMKQRYTRVGPEVRLLRFPEHLWGHGLNNVLQETFLMSYLAYLTNRSFVYEEYTWSKDSPFHWTIGDGMNLRPSRVPMTAFISGFIVGTQKSIISLNNTSRPVQVSMSTPSSSSSVNVEYWHQICANSSAIAIVNSEDMPEELMDGQKLIDDWVQRLTTGDVASARCVQVDGPGSQRKPSSQQIFDKHLFGSPSTHSVLPGLIKSPVISEFGWSPLVNMVLSKNRSLLQLRPQDPSNTPNSSSATLSSVVSPDTSIPSPRPDTSQSQTSSTPRFPGMVAVHIRRGDYERHCPRLAKWGSMYIGVNRLPGLVDRFEPWMAMSDAGVEESDLDITAESQSESNVCARRGWFDGGWWWSWLTSSSNSTGRMSAQRVGLMGTTPSTPRYNRNFSDLDIENWHFEDALVKGEARQYWSKKSLWSVFWGSSQRMQDLPSELLEYYMRHCFPSVEQIRKRLKEVREEVLDTSRESPSKTFGSSRVGSSAMHADHVARYGDGGLRRVYILTNESGKSLWMRKLKEGLLDDGWEDVIVSGDLDLDVDGKLELDDGFGTCSGHGTGTGQSDGWGGKDLRVGRKEAEGVMMAVDMAIAQGADVFVGNGFSSVSANTILLRLADGKDISTNRFL